MEARMNIDSVVREVVGSILSKALDPNPVTFKRADEAGLGPVRTGCQKPAGSLHTFRRELNRNAFLCGCHDFTDEAPVEHLIVGFGFQHGSTTVVESMAHAIGTEGAVSIPDHVAAAIRQYVQKEHANEVLLFHNHPRNPINIVFDNTPLPSGTDRRTLVSFHSDLKVLGKALMGGGRVRFYIGENGFVQEFRTPDLLPVLERLAQPAPRP
ncbi:MAG: hypothetical protein KF699_10565 [Phycisphaeraceae bacterium]|nr:hypothetical protein [Phycisphaeraceae bacterium]